MNKTVEKIISERLTPEHKTDNNTYRLAAQEIIYMTYQGIAAGYEMPFKYNPYRVSDYTNKIPKPLQALAKRIIEKHTSGMVDGVFGKMSMCGSQTAYERMVEQAYNCGKDYKEMIEKFEKEYEI